jgi:hypothetical protein
VRAPLGVGPYNWPPIWWWLQEADRVARSGSPVAVPDYAEWPNCGTPVIVGFRECLTCLLGVIRYSALRFELWRPARPRRFGWLSSGFKHLWLRQISPRALAEYWVRDKKVGDQAAGERLSQ